MIAKTMQNASATIKNTGGVLFAIAFSALLATFNETFLNVALTPIMADLSVNAGTVQWVTTAYMLMASIMVPVTGFLYRSVPTKRLQLIAIAFLFAGTLIGAAAVNFAMLLVGRVVQAVGTGMIVPLGMNVTLAVAPRGKLGTYMGVVSAMTTLGPAFGPIVSGLVLSVGTWHTLFVVFAVLVAITAVLAVAFIPNVGELTHPKLDMVSTCLVSLALIGILYGVSTAFSGTVVVTCVSLAIGIACLAVFIMRQRTLPEPLLDLRPFRSPAFVMGILVIMMAFMTVFAMNMILPLFMQGALGFTAFDAAITLLPASILSCVLAPVAGRIYDVAGLRVMLPIGLALIVVFGFALSQCGEGATSLVLVAFYAPVIIGCALTMGPTQTFALSSLKHELYSHGTTVVAMALQIAGCVGSSVFVGVLSSIEAGQLAAGASNAAATTAGFESACHVAVVLAIIGFVLSLFIGRIDKKRRASMKPANEGGAAPDGAPADAAASANASHAGSRA